MFVGFNCECLIIVNCKLLFLAHNYYNREVYSFCSIYAYAQTSRERNNWMRNARKDASAQLFCYAIEVHCNIIYRLVQGYGYTCSSNGYENTISTSPKVADTPISDILLVHH